MKRTAWIAAACALCFAAGYLVGVAAPDKEAQAAPMTDDKQQEPRTRDECENWVSFEPPEYEWIEECEDGRTVDVQYETLHCEGDEKWTKPGKPTGERIVTGNPC